jgi:hypothetical protein
MTFDAHYALEDVIALRRILFAFTALPFGRIHCITLQACVKF